MLLFRQQDCVFSFPTKKFERSKEMQQDCLEQEKPTTSRVEVINGKKNIPIWEW